MKEFAQLVSDRTGSQTRAGWLSAHVPDPAVFYFSGPSTKVSYLALQLGWASWALTSGEICVLKNDASAKGISSS